jgi:hypothetical protein
VLSDLRALPSTPLLSSEEFRKRVLDAHANDIAASIDHEDPQLAAAEAKPPIVHDGCPLTEEQLARLRPNPSDVGESAIAWLVDQVRAHEDRLRAIEECDWLPE